MTAITTTSTALTAAVPAASLPARTVAPADSPYLQTAANVAPLTAPPSAEIARLQSILTALMRALHELHAQNPTIVAPSAATTLAPRVAPAVQSTAPVTTAPVNPSSISVSGATPAERQILNAAITKMSQIGPGTQIAQQLQATGARIVIDDDATLDAQGYANARAIYNETDDEIHLRRSMLQNPDSTALIQEIAHEGTHEIDAKSPAKRAFMQRGEAYVAQLGGTSTAAGAAAQKQLLLQDSLITETNAHYNAAQILEQLGVQQSQWKTGGPAWAAMSSGDTATIRQNIWNALLKDPNYNPDGMSVGYTTYG